MTAVRGPIRNFRPTPSFSSINIQFSYDLDTQALRFETPVLVNLQTEPYGTSPQEAHRDVRLPASGFTRTAFAVDALEAGEILFLQDSDSSRALTPVD